MAKMAAKDKFQKIKDLKDSGKITSEIARELDFKEGYVSWIIGAINKGFNSMIPYSNYLIKNKINPETEKEFTSSTENANYIARKNGYVKRRQ